MAKQHFIRETYNTFGNLPAVGVSHILYELNNGDLYRWNSVLSAYTSWSTAGSGETLSQVLSNGNTTSNGQTIEAANGGGYLNLRNGADNKVLINNKSGNTSGEQLILENGYVELSSNSNAGWVGIYSDVVEIVSSGIPGPADNSYTLMADGHSTGTTYLGVSNVYDVIKINGSQGLSNATVNSDKPGAIISSRNSMIGSSVRNSAVIGGLNITADTSNTLYTQNARLAENSGVIFSAGTDLYDIFATGAALSATTLSQVLSNGNTTGGNDIIVTSGQTITSSTGNGQINLRDSAGQSNLTITNDGGAQGESGLYFDIEEFAMFGTGWECAVQYTGSLDIYNHRSIDAARVINIGVSQTNWDIRSAYNATNDVSSHSSDMNAVFISNRNSTIGSATTNSFIGGGSGHTINKDLRNTVILGGSDITATQDDSLYTQNARLAENSGVIFSAGTDLYNIFGAGGGETLAQTLAIGNNTGGNDITLAEGDSIIMHNNSGGTGVSYLQWSPSTRMYYDADDDQLLYIYGQDAGIFMASTNSILDIGDSFSARVPGTTASNQRTFRINKDGNFDFQVTTGNTTIGLISIGLGEFDGFIIKSGITADRNWAFPDGSGVLALQSDATANTLSQVLSNGNTTGANDIIVLSGQVIESSTGNGQINLRDSAGQNNLTITNDGGAQGESGIYLDTNEFAMFGEGWNCAVQFNQGFLDIYNQTSVDAARSIAIGVGNGTSQEIKTSFNSNNDVDSYPSDKQAVFVGTKSSTIESATTNSVIIGGSGHTINKDLTNVVVIGGQSITATQSNSLYTQNARLAENSGVIYSGGTDLYNIFASSSLSLSQVLTNGNTTSNGQTIQALNGGGELDLRYGANGRVALTTDSGALAEQGLYMDHSSDYQALFAGGYYQVLELANGSGDIALYNTSGDGRSVQIGVNDGAGIYSEFDEIKVTNNITTNATTGNNDKSAVIVSSRNATINAGVTNTAIVGGVNITATQDDTLYTQNLRATDTVHADQFFSMAPYTDSSPASPSDNDVWFHSGATGSITLNYRIGGATYNVELSV